MKGAVIVTRLTIYGQKSDTEGGGVGEVPTVPHSKTNKETRLVERNIYFILDAGMGQVRVDTSPKADSLNP